MQKNNVSRRKFISIFATLALVVSMFGFTGTAFATVPTSGTFVLLGSGEVVQGDSIDLWHGVNSDDVPYISDIVVTPADADEWHFDFGVVDTSHPGGYGPSDGYVTVNKHTGELTGLRETEPDTPSIVYVFMTPEAMPDTPNPNNPCLPETESLYIQFIKITVAPPVEYGYQGLDNALYMNSPTVTDWEGDDTDGYINQLGTLTPDAGNLYFNYTQLAGFNGIPSDTYTSSAYNGDNVILADSKGDPIQNLANFYSPADDTKISLGEYDSTTRTVELVVNMGTLPPGNYQLQFTEDFRGGGSGGRVRTLEIPVTFDFAI